MTLQTLSLNRSYGGSQGVYRHKSQMTQTDMTFSVFVPAHREGTKLAAVSYLSGLTCTHANVTEKGEYRSSCAELGFIFVAPDTSPRGADVPGDPANAYDFGLGAGFYVDATQEPFARNYRMWSYVTEELPKLVAENFPADAGRQSILGHSMGGHGALTVALRHPDRYPHHLPSVLFDPGESSRLAEFLKHVDVAVSLHGYGRIGRSTQLLAGGRNRALAAHLARRPRDRGPGLGHSHFRRC